MSSAFKLEKEIGIFYPDLKDQDCKFQNGPIVTHDGQTAFRAVHFFIDHVKSVSKYRGENIITSMIQRNFLSMIVIRGRGRQPTEAIRKSLCILYMRRPLITAWIPNCYMATPCKLWVRETSSTKALKIVLQEKRIERVLFLEMWWMINEGPRELFIMTLAEGFQMRFVERYLLGINMHRRPDVENEDSLQ